MPGDDRDLRGGRLLVALMLLGGLLFGLARSTYAQDNTGAIASANGAVTFSLSNVPSAVVQFTGTWSGRVVFEATVDGGTTWQPVSPTLPTTGARAPEATANGLFVLQNVGFTAARVRAASWGSGTANVAVTRGFVATTAPAVQPVQVTQTLTTSPAQALGWPCNALTRAAGQCK